MCAGTHALTSGRSVDRSWCYLSAEACAQPCGGAFPPSMLALLCLWSIHSINMEGVSTDGVKVHYGARPRCIPNLVWPFVCLRCKDCSHQHPRILDHKLVASTCLGYVYEHAIMPNHSAWPKSALVHDTVMMTGPCAAPPEHNYLNTQRAAAREAGTRMLVMLNGW